MTQIKTRQNEFEHKQFLDWIAVLADWNFSVQPQEKSYNFPPEVFLTISEANSNRLLPPIALNILASSSKQDLMQ